MITFTDHFNPQRETIKNLLLTAGKEPKTTYYCHRHTDYDLTQEELERWYDISFRSFPVYTAEKSAEVAIPNTFLHTYRKYHRSKPFKETLTERRQEVDGIDRAGLLLDLEEFIWERIDNTFHEFAYAIRMLKEGPVFACVHDDLIIMKNLLKFYTDIRVSADIQLVFLHQLTIPKAVADQMTDVLIMLLADRIKMHDPKYDPGEAVAIIPREQNTFKIAWLATQQEFAELIHELTKKGYIDLPDVSYSLQASSLAKMFDFSVSSRKEDPNIANNILTLIKPILDKDENTTKYSYLKPGYKRKFDAITAFLPKKKKT